jgi:PAS domain S-box-containing protein
MAGMDRLDTTVYFVSAVLQLAAMVFAIRMSMEVADRRPWLLMLLALAVMFGARILALLVPLQIRQHLGPFIAVVISSLLLIALFAIRRVATAERLSRLSAATSAAERDASEGRYRSLVELSPDVVFVNADGRIAYANTAAVKFFGAKNAEELIGRSPLEFVASSSRPMVESRVHRLIAQGGIAPPVTEDWLRLDGSNVPVEAIAAIVPWREGTAIQVILRDISERKRAEEEKSRLLASERAARSAAEHASRMKDEFLATLSHELRTPLNAIVGWSHLLLRGEPDDADFDQGLSTIERNARVQTRLIEDLLDMSRIISGKLRLDVQQVLPLTFVEAAINSVKPAADAKEIRLEQILDGHAGPVAGDPSRLQQVVWNILSNAIKFTPKGGRVQVILRRADSQIELSVADTGQGITPEFMPFVFDRFRQADASTTRKMGGLGIGLAIAKQLVDLHGGSISVRSPGEGMGSTFTVQLPLMVVHANKEESGWPPANVVGMKNGNHSPIALQGVRVLVVDDEADARDLIRRVLEDCNAEVSTAGSAAEAVPILEAQRFHVLVSDIGMPAVDGYEFLRQVRLLKPENGGRIPAIALTAFARSEDRTRALMAGYQVHVAKPVEPAELVATVASVAGLTGGKSFELPAIQ